MHSITFEKVSLQDKATIFSWLNEPHVKEFWDNSQEHRDDIINFVGGRKTPSNYFDGIFTYWIGSIDAEPYCLVMTSEFLPGESLSKLHQDNLSKTGKTYGLDFCIGNKKYLGKGIAASTLEAFTKFFQADIDNGVDKFFIDPDDNNPRAKHVYTKAGFREVGEFKGERKYWDFDSDQQYLMVKELPIIAVSLAANNDIPKMVELSYIKRRSYESAQPQFWKWAGEKGEEIQAKWFEQLIHDEKHIVLCAKSHEQIVGFIIGKIVPAPEVYNPGGSTLMIDDFCVEEGNLWESVGAILMGPLKTKAKAKGATQILVVCGAHDDPKRQFLMNQNLSIASEWFVGNII